MQQLYTNLFPLCVVILILADTHYNLNPTRMVCRCRNMLIFVSIILLSDIYTWGMQGKEFPGARTLLWIANILYYTLSVEVAFQWFVYVGHTLMGDKKYEEAKGFLMAAAMPMVLFLVILVIWPTRIFFITPDNYYVRGDYFFIQTAIGFAYMLAASCFALFYGLREKVPDRRREDFLVASFVFYPLTGGIIQVLDVNIVLIWPLATAAMFLVYVNLRQEQIRKDELTGLQNRRSLDEYLKRKFDKSVRGDEWYLFIIDLNGFKETNDTYGHTAGDELLQEVSRILQSVFSVDRAFVARYGGDEFAVVLDCSEQEVRQYQNRLQQKIQQRNETASNPCSVSLGIGKARYRYGMYDGVGELLIEADRKMYRNKEECKRLREA